MVGQKGRAVFAHVHDRSCYECQPKGTSRDRENDVGFVLPEEKKLFQLLIP